MLVTSKLTAVYSWLSAVVTLNMQAPPSTLSCARLWLRCAGLTSVPLTPSDANHITVWQKRTRSAQSGIRRGDFTTANSECRIPRRAMSIDQVTSQLTSGIAKLVLGSFDRNIFRHQNRQLNENKYFSLYFPQSPRHNSIP